MTQEDKTPTMSPRWIALIVVVVAVFAGTYGLALASGRTAAPAVASSGAVQASTQPAAAAGAGCACCTPGAGASGTASTGSASVAGGVQKISVDLSSGAYDPSAISLKAGIPAEITFGKGSGCLATVQSSDLGFSQDLTRGPRTVKLPALQPGTYSFSCGMQMVFGKIIVS